VDWIGYSLAVALGYGVGSIPSGYLMGRAQGIDLRQAGSGNIGATNAFRILGTAAGIVVLLADGLKGFVATYGLPPLLLRLMTAGAATVGVRENLAIAAGFGAILGHIFTFWLRFKGGKGIATTAGVFLALAPKPILITIVIWITVCGVSRYVSLASIAAAVALPASVWACHCSPLLITLTSLIGVLAIYKHKMNLQRLLHGTEHRLGSGKKLASANGTR
jgi:acyl phosphate:glycerol-3-phosphate acyltransferase